MSFILLYSSEFILMRKYPYSGIIKHCQVLIFYIKYLTGTKKLMKRQLYALSFSQLKALKYCEREA